MSRAWSETALSRGVVQAGSDARNAFDVEHDCALTTGAKTSAEAKNAIESAAGDRQEDALLLRANSRRRSPVENGDVSLPLDASTE